MAPSYRRALRAAAWILALGLSGPTAAEPPARHPALDPPRLEGTRPAPRDQRLQPRGGASEWVFHRSADGDHPDGLEQEMVWLVNRARSDPDAEGAWLATSSDPDIAVGRNFFGVNVGMLQSEFAALPPSPPAAFDRRLYEASLAHSLDLIARDAQDHNGQIERVIDSGFEHAGGRLSVFSYADSPLNAHAALNIDWGPGDGSGMQPGRGHRLAIMGDYDAVGLALVPENDGGTSVGPLVFSGAYLYAAPAPNQFPRFLVGTVWKDLDLDGRYDAGEGYEGVTVMPNLGSWYAVTSPGGGYTIPITAPGAYQVTFSGGGIGPSQQRSANVGSDSELLDLELPAPEPGQLLLFATGAATLALFGRRARNRVSPR
jgi:hypothetical protein